MKHGHNNPMPGHSSLSVVYSANEYEYMYIAASIHSRALRISSVFRFQYTESVYGI